MTIRQRARKTRRPHEWSKADLKLLGKLSDREVARRLGIGRHAVLDKRHELGIEPRQIIDWTEHQLARLGTMPDTHLAREIGCSHQRVQEKRTALGIPPFSPKGHD